MLRGHAFPHLHSTRILRGFADKQGLILGQICSAAAGRLEDDAVSEQDKRPLTFELAGERSASDKQEEDRMERKPAGRLGRSCLLCEWQSWSGGRAQVRV